MTVSKQKVQHSPDTIRAFFARSNYLDRMVLRPLSHIASNWELTWDGDSYKCEPSSFAEDLNILIEAIAKAPRPPNYHDSRCDSQLQLLAGLSKKYRVVGSAQIIGRSLNRAHLETLTEKLD